MPFRIPFMSMVMAFGVGCSELPPEEPTEPAASSMIGVAQAEEMQPSRVRFDEEKPEREASDPGPVLYD